MSIPYANQLAGRREVEGRWVMNESDSRPASYIIRFAGHVDPGSGWFEGMTLTDTGFGETILSGPIVDQAALHGLLARICDLNLVLISVVRVESKQSKGE